MSKLKVGYLSLVKSSWINETLERRRQTALNDLAGLDIELVDCGLLIQSEVEAERVCEKFDAARVDVILAHFITFSLGTVVPGRGLGRKLGIPTANLNPHNEVAPPDGVYIVRARWDGVAYPGIVNLGVRPTVTRLPSSGVRRPASVLELHLFGLRRNLYGKAIEVTFLKKLRRERVFPSLEALQRQIRKDIERAKLWFGHN